MPSFLVLLSLMGVDLPARGDGSGSTTPDVAQDYLLGPRSDVDENGQIDAVDVQLVINEALDIPTGYDCDINQDGDVNALDVQSVINGALGLK